MNNLEVTFFAILILIFSSFGWFNMGFYFGEKKAKNETTIECVEKPELCKQRYEYMRLGEKLGEY